MAKKTSPADKKSNKDTDDTASKLAAHKTQDQLNPHHQNAKPKGKK
ncbi:MAG TPA: hypothetical protein VGK23_06465 [Methanomassiliicoccales archaeon]|jgi:hypothetical protein